MDYRSRVNSHFFWIVPLREIPRRGDYLGTASLAMTYFSIYAYAKEIYFCSLIDRTTLGRILFNISCLPCDRKK